MTEAPLAMSAERFQALAAAYGAAMETWPASERDAGRAFALTPHGRRILGWAGRLDLALHNIENHGCIRLASLGRADTSPPASKPPAGAGLPSRPAPPARRSRSDKLQALMSGSRFHVR